MRLEEKEVDNIELNVGLLRACKDERTLFCGGVAPGQARVFRCLAENMGNGDFGGPVQEPHYHEAGTQVGGGGAGTLNPSRVILKPRRVP